MRRRLASGELIRDGILFSKEIDMKTGWIWRSPGSMIGRDGTEVNLGLGFLDERLESLYFGLVEAPHEMTARFAFHERFLKAQRGKPTSFRMGQTLYRYRRGSISAEADLRGGNSDIILAWD